MPYSSPHLPIRVYLEASFDFTANCIQFPACPWVSAKGMCTQLQYSCLENPMDGGAVVHGVSKSWTRLSEFTFTFHLHALEKEMATHSSVLAWRIPGPGSLVGCHLWGRKSWTQLKWLSSKGKWCWLTLLQQAHNESLLCFFVCLLFSFGSVLFTSTLLT